MYKKERLAEQLHSFIAGELRGFHEEAFSLITLTEVRPSRDYKSATIYWTMPNTTGALGADGQPTIFASKEERELMQKALNKRVAPLKRRIAAELTLRYTPSLNFVFDESAERGSKIDELLKKAGY